MTALSEHFSLEELIHTDTGLPNYPGDHEMDALRRTAQRMEEVRTILVHPIAVSSGYRSPAVNAAVGSAPTSDHINGDAVDFTCPGFGPPLKVCQALQASGIGFDQLIYEGTWTHISFGPRMRQQCLSMRKANGHASYLPGIVP